jgi:hypothetical protein
MQSNEPKKPRRARRTALATAGLGAILLGWLLRDCGFGLGGLGGLRGDLGIGPDEQTTQELLAPRDAAAAAVPLDAPPGPCQLFLSSEGLTLGNAPVTPATPATPVRPVTIDEAVQACRAAGKARVRATGGARAGTHDDLMRALEQAGIAVERE